MENIENKIADTNPETYTPCTNPGCRKLSVTNWLKDLNLDGNESEYVEVQFKNTRKGFFVNSDQLLLKEGDLVAVETSPGHDIGYVSLVGELVVNQMRKNRIQLDRYDFKRVYRLAKPSDIEKWERIKEREHPTMIRAREIAKRLNLNMKIGDVEFQGDGNKAIFYYIADKRVDFRQLIKDLAAEFGVRIEMRQIGARQEAGQIGGIGPCGREICCSKWNTNFASVNTSAARIQELSLNPEKLTGMCAKLKCCLNYEVDMYQEALEKFPSKNKRIETKEGVYRHVKNDALKGQITYILTKKDAIPVFATISIERANELIALNNNGETPEVLVEAVVIQNENLPDYENVVGQDDLTRFDKPANKNKKRRNNRNKKRRPNNTQAKSGNDNRNNTKNANAKNAKAKSPRGENAKRGDVDKSSNKPRNQKRSNRPPSKDKKN